MRYQFVDCRFGTGRPEGGEDAYLAGHIPGAAYADSERDLAGRDGGGRHPLPTEASFAAWASRAGIGPGVLVVAYDQGTGWAARLWWLLRHFGHDDAAILHVAAWRGPLRAGPEEIEPAEFVPRLRGNDTAEADELLARLGDHRLTLVDVRSPERWRGEVEPIDPVAGRIPGATNLFFQAAYPPPPELLEAGELVVYCGSGVTACAGLHALALAGRADARLYPGSWSEWCALGGPVERG